MSYAIRTYSEMFVGRVGLALLLLSSAVGCKVGPNYAAPQPAVLSNWSVDYRPRPQSQPADPSRWWEHLSDPMLTNLVQATVAQNLSLKEAGQRVLEARARRGIAAGNLLPQIQAANGGYSKSRLSSNAANFFSVPGFFVTDVNPENWSLGLNASWELDFWGRYRRSVESADAALESTEAAFDDALVLLLAEVANTYVELRTFECRQNLARQNLEVQRGVLRIARQKREAGLASTLDVAQSESLVGQTASALPAMEIERRKASHRLCVLIGRLPVDLAPEIGHTGNIPRPAPNLGIGAPADLLRRRPDVRRAERDLAAQCARIGVAESEFYPHISLAGSIGYSSEKAGNLVSSRSAAGIIAPQFSWNLLNYGRIRSNVEAETAAFQRLAWAYHQAVLVAQAEAEDAQVAYLLNFERAASLQFAAQASAVALEKAERNFQEGTIDFGRVYVLQAELLRQQEQLAIVHGETAGSMIALFKAMGGGWELRHCGDSSTVAAASPAF